MQDDSSNMTNIRMQAELAANSGMSQGQGYPDEQSAAETVLQQATAADRATQAVQGGGTLTGDELHAELLRRAEARQHLTDTLGGDAKFFDYKRSEVGGIGGSQEIRAQVVEGSRKDRERREERFSQRHDARDKRHQRGSTTGEGRQSFNSSRGGDSGGGPRFSEPASRSYNPYG